MKKIFTVMAMAFMALGFATVSTSCSSDDDEEYAPANANSAIIGDWGVVTTNVSTDNVEWAGEMIFSANGSVTVMTETPQLLQWNLNEKTLELINGSEKVVNTIKQQDDITLLLEYTQDGTRYTMLMKRMESQASLRNLVGTWELGEPLILNPDETEITVEDEYIIFNADGTCVAGNEKGEWQFDGQTMVIRTEDGMITGVVKEYDTMKMTVEFDLDGTKFLSSMFRIK